MNPTLVVWCSVVDALVLTSVLWGAWGAWTAVRARAWLAVGLSALCALGGVAGSVSCIQGAFAASAMVDPAQRSVVLASGISAGLAPAQVGWIGALVVLALGLVGLWRSRTE